MTKIEIRAFQFSRPTLISVLLWVIFAWCVSAQAQDVVTAGTINVPQEVPAGGKFTVEFPFSVSAGWHINSNKPNDEFLIPTVISAQCAGLKLVSVKYPKAENIKLEFSDAPVSVYEGNVKAMLMFQALENAPAGKQKGSITLEYQACNNQSCMPPNSITASFEIFIKGGATGAATDTTATKADTLPVAPTTDTIKEEPRANAAPQVEDGSIASTLEKSGLLFSLLFVFLAGLALNLTPCVYPIIPITIGYFGGQAEGKTSRLFMLGVLYMLGMALTYSVIGVVTSLSGAVFGSLMQNPYVITGIVILFIVLALSQFGVYEFQLPHSLVEKAGGAKGGMYGAFFMGLTMGIVAAPCIGPFVLGLVTYVAVKGDPWYGFVMFFTLALGLGFPYLILAIFSGKIKSLPRSGVWMEGVKHVFGLILLGMAFYFLDPVLPKAVRGYPLPVFGIIAAVILLFFDKTANNVKAFRIFKTGFAVLVLAVSIYALIPKEKLTPAWKKFDNLSFEQALQNGDKVFIDFYADWCIPCKELDQLTFSDKRVIRALEGFTCFKVDMTQATEAGENLRKQFKVVGMPTLIIFDSKGVEQKRETGFLNADAMLERLATVK